ncbi:NAD(P)-dependent dehydrogenase (short-subunit alcohol dehydrogenase family) [Paraburkholderia sp. CI3]
MIIDLSGKIAIVSASSGGIGVAIATGIATAGADTIVNLRETRGGSIADTRHLRIRQPLEGLNEADRSDRIQQRDDVDRQHEDGRVDHRVIDDFRPCSPL